MDAPEVSCSSTNLAADEPMLSHGGRTGGECVRQSHASASDGSNAPLAATTLKSHPISPSNATVAIKLNPTLPKNVSTSVIQSSWIQRLKPFSQSNTSKEEPAEPSTKEKDPVCTHFTRDFSSCSRRLNKTSQHTRSSSWPPRALHLQGVDHSLVELGKPADITEEHGKAAVNSLDIDRQSIQVPSNNITHSSGAGSRTGNLFAQQQSSCKQVSAVEGFVPCSLSREDPTLKKLNDLQESESGGDSKPKECLTQKIEDVKKVNAVGECNGALQMKALVQTEEAGKNWDYYYGSCGASKGDMCAPVFSVSACRAAHDSGASADADDKIFLAKSLNCCTGNETFSHQTSFVKPDCEVAYSTAVVSENRVSVNKAGEDWWRFGREAAQHGPIIGPKGAGNLGSLRTVRNLKQLKESVAEPYTIINLSNVGASRKTRLSPRNSHLSEAFINANERVAMKTCAAGFRTVAASASLKKDISPKRSDTFYARENNLANLSTPHYSEAGTSRSTLPVGEDAARSRIREISLGEYWNSWVRLLEEPDNVKPGEAGSPTASTQQDYVVEDYHKNLLQPPLSKARLDARPASKLEVYWSCSPHKQVSDDAENLGSCDLPQGMLASSSRKNYKSLDTSQTKTGWGQDYYASADQSSQFSLKGLQQSQKHERCFYRGATGRVDSQLRNEDSGLHKRFLGDGSSHSRMHSTHQSQEHFNNERTGEGSSMHQVWLWRWHSSAKFSAMTGKATSHVPYFSRRLSSDELVKSCSASTGFPLISSHKATGSFEHNLTDSGGGSNRYTEASGTRLDSGSASTKPRSLLASRNFAAFRSGYMGSCVETTAIVSRSASKLPPTSVQNRGFCGLPCLSPKFVKCKVLPEDEKMHSPESDELKVLERSIDDS